MSVAVTTVPALPLKALSTKLWMELEEVVKEMEKLVGTDMLKGLEPIYDKIINETIKPLIKAPPSEVDTVFKEKRMLFANYFTKISSSITESLVLSKTGEELRNSLRRFKKIEYRIYGALKDEIEKSEFNGIENILYAISIAADYDLWVINSILEVGFEEFIRRVDKRASDEIHKLIGYLLSLTYSLMACLFVMLRYKAVEVSKPVAETFNILVSWCSKYADELDLYVDTINLLISDEYYGVIKDYIEM